MINPKKSKYGTGSITKKSDYSYHVYYNNKYYCACTTYEQAYYTKQQFNKLGWDKKNLPLIQSTYPQWYTDLLIFYEYIIPNNFNLSHKGKWAVTITVKNNPYADKLEHILYKNLEDALYERDILRECNWDYNILTEIIDDSLNPYYEMELPPYPQRKIRGHIKRENYDQKIRQIQELILNDETITQKQTAEKLNITVVTLRNWLKSYNTTWSELYNLVTAGEEPLELLTQEPLIIQPDLTKPPQKKFKHYIHNNEKDNKTNPYKIVRKRICYGSYPTFEFALKISKDLEKCGWDKKQLPKIQKKHGHNIKENRNHVYKHKNGFYTISKSFKNKKNNYGSYFEKELAEYARDILIECNFDKNEFKKYLDENNIPYRWNGYNNIITAKKGEKSYE